ncbi:MAG TPA: ATP-binding protein [Ktedonobacteraceae bacterium]|nr:ATP-binding protein [Ktedonobacteraceae bacterium]
MGTEYTTQLQHILERMTVGAAILDCATLRVVYANSYLISFFPEPWRTQGLTGRLASELLPADLYELAAPLFLLVRAEGHKKSFAEVPYEGFLETRGRTYWHISLELIPASPASQEPPALLILLEDVTSSVRARLQLEATRHISAAIAGQSPLKDVLERILLAMQDLVGSRRCAVLLIDAEGDEAAAERVYQERADTNKLLALSQPSQMVTIAAQQGLYRGAENWRPRVSERLLLGKVLSTRQALVVTDTSTMPEIEFPVLDDEGQPRRPGSAVSVPILETLPEGVHGALLGTIEIYHRRARGLPNEEVELLERFATQAGLAIQNARVFQRIKHLARLARQQAHQLENVMRAIPDGVIIYDAEWRLLEINHAARRLLGWSDHDIGLHISQAIASSKARFAQNSPQISRLIADLEQQQTHYRSVDEIEMVGADGHAYTMRRSKAPIRDETGQTFAYVVVYHDITEQAAARRQIEEEVRARTAELAQRNTDLQAAQSVLRLYTDRLRLMLERLPAGVMLISLESQQIGLMNNQARHLLQLMGLTLPRAEQEASIDDAQLSDAGVQIEDLLRTVTMYDIAGAVVPYEKQPLYQALHHNRASEAEYFTVLPDGQLLNLLLNAAPLPASDGTAINVVQVLQDITWIKAMERAREHFFTTMAHELKTPLANIRAHLSALQTPDMTWAPDQQLAFVSTADEQVERLVGMINHFLDASRVEAGALRPELEPILLAEMFEDLQERLEALIASSQRRLEVRVPPALPAVQADYELIMSVLTNLLSNAFRYAPIGDAVYLEALVRGPAERPEGVTLRVIDHGPGIPPERQAVLFTRFSTFTAARGSHMRSQASRTGQEKRRGQDRWSPATGLGLYISKGIIEAHGSTLELESTPGKGTMFAFTLALAPTTRSELA